MRKLSQEGILITNEVSKVYGFDPFLVFVIEDFIYKEVTEYFNDSKTTKRKFSTKWNLKNGPFLEYHENGKIYIDCQYFNDELHGEYKTYHPNGNLCVETVFDFGKRNGIYNEYRVNGKPKKSCYYINDNIDGIYKEYYDAPGNPKLYRKTTYVNGLRNGVEKLYFENGNVEQRYEYINDLRYGKFIWFYWNGKVFIESNYINDKLNGNDKVFYDNGNIYINSHYKDNVKHGLYEQYRQNGQIACRMYYINDKINGEYMYWNQRGHLTNLYQFKMNERHGESKRWHNNGRLAHKCNFIDGKIVGDDIKYSENGELEERKFYFYNMEIRNGFWIIFQIIIFLKQLYNFYI